MKFSRATTITGIFLFMLLLTHISNGQLIPRKGGFDYEDLARKYELYLPQNFQPNMPLVISLHGYTETIPWYKEYTLLHEFADTSGFITVYPAAIDESWNSGLVAPGWPYIDTTVNDVGFISELIDVIDAKYDIDLSRVYCCGYSLGGEMTYRLAIELGQRFAAVASVTGLINDVSGNLGNPIRPIPILHIHGTSDNYETWNGDNKNLWTVPETINFWVQNNNCTGFYNTVSLPDLDPNDGCTIEKISYKDYSDNEMVVFYKIMNGGHHWPDAGFNWGGGNLNRDINANTEIWNFFKDKINPLVKIGNENSWTRKANIPTPRCWASSCELDGKIYVIGGISTAGWNAPSIGTMDVYDPATDTWDTTKKPMPTNRSEFCACVVDGKIYAIGGVPSYEKMPLGTVEVYDPLTNSWDVSKTPMPTPRTSQACGVIDNKIYIAGGTAFSSLKASNKLEIYDPATDTWSSGANMPIARYHPSSAVLNDTLYIIGGLNLQPPYAGYRTVQKYNPTTDSWSLGIQLHEGRVGHTTSVVEGKIYTIGGQSARVPADSVEQYNPILNSWTFIDSIPGAMFLPTASVFGSEIYLFGGSNSMSNPTPTATVYSYKPPNPTSVEIDENITPTDFILYQNYPNPFNPSTTIKYTIPSTVIPNLVRDLSTQIPDQVRNNNVSVQLKVYDILGREVTTIVNKEQKPGYYEVKWVANNQSSGVYFYRIVAGEFIETKKMLLLR